MTADLSKVPLLARREIEARIVAPVLEALAPLCGGREKALAGIGQAVAGLSRAWGADMAAKAGDERGLAELGVVMSCQRDFAFFEGFNPRIRLTRTMAGPRTTNLPDRGPHARRWPRSPLPAPPSARKPTNANPTAPRRAAGAAPPARRA